MGSEKNMRQLTSLNTHRIFVFFADVSLLFCEFFIGHNS